MKYRALRIDNGNFAWGTEVCTRKVRILDVVYNASNNEYVRTNTVTKNTIVSIDATPFKQYYEQRYGKEVLKKKSGKVIKEDKKEEEEKKISFSVKVKQEKRAKEHVLDPHLYEQLANGRILACISSRPGQSGRADGYILEAKELEFYLKKLAVKKTKKSA